jgi:cytosine/adenosine deaminase-related metal-dependent hydrolase
MRAALVHSRGAYNNKFTGAGKLAAQINHTVQEAYALGTIQGAKAVGMENEIGSLAVGKKADIVVFDALSPSMICGAQYDPVTAIVMHSTPGDIIMTFVDGILRKSEGKVLPVEVSAEDTAFAGVESRTISWADVSKNLLQTQETVQAKVEKLDLKAAKGPAMSSFGMDPSLLTAKL